MRKHWSSGRVSPNFVRGLDKVIFRLKAADDQLRVFVASTGLVMLLHPGE